MDPVAAQDYWSPVSPLRAGLGCRCPRCGRGPLFAGFLTIRPACPACGLDLNAVDPGDGPAVFVILILGFLVVGLGLWIELTWRPPLWLHIAIEFPVIILGALALLRPLKALMVALQFRNKAREYRIGD